ncbi:Dyp-type peroxidase [Neptuniibacter halophilus]|uniref:Dyp-type peroxidase n=1 Tax=Neptuniibacter halophilus TaxID=651666 RepID=UPI00257474C5|nr:Dyp-type peroxidase [Neptuniibacter halophilus]
MAQFQSGVVAEASPAALFLTFNQSRNDGALAKVKTVLAKIPALQQLFNDNNPDADLHIVAAIGSSYWSQLGVEGTPASLQPFPSFEKGEMVAPNTPVDLLFHIRSARKDLNFMLAQRLVDQLGDAVTLVEEVEGFRYLDSRDLTGFVDGTENPQGDDRIDVAVVADEDLEFSGGSYIHLQRYVHNMAFWNRQPLKVQEDTIGRTKSDNVEYPSAEKDLTAHTKRTSLKDAEGRSIEILRHSMPYGSTEECGLLFASYCRSPENFTLMLQSMIEGDGEGHSDHLLKYTRAVTGQAFFAPSVAFLQGL